MLQLALLFLLSCQPVGPVSVQRDSVTIDPWADPDDQPRVQIVADLMDRSDGRMGITMRYSGLTDQMWSFRAPGVAPELAYHDVHFSTVQGKEISYRQHGRAYDLKGGAHDEVVVSYDVEPGGDGRHGHQGIVEDDFALFDGRVFLVPNGGGSLRAARIRYQAPDGWTAADALRQDDDGWIYFDNYGPSLVATSLTTACFGVGPFDVTTKPLGDSEVRVFNYSGFDKTERQKLTTRSMAMFGWFHDVLGFQPQFPLAVVWSPKHDGDKVFGGSSANGTCFQQPKSNPRAWQLMAHRLGHSMNKYAPSGMHIRDERDEWFMEGWPSYVEIKSTKGAGVASRENRWNELYNSFKRTRRDQPEKDIAMGVEHTAKSDWTEYLHYFKAPLVVELLDDWIKRRYNKNLTEFMRLMWVKHGYYQSPLPLREELEAYVGASLDDFWALHVDQRGWIYPVWPEAITPALKRRAAPPAQDAPAPAATVGGRPVDGDYLYFLASTGDFDRYGDIVTFLEKEEPRRAQLEAAGIHLLPPALEKYRVGFAPAERYNLARAEQAYPIIQPPPPPAPGQGFVLDDKDSDAVVFAQLLKDEQTYESAVTKAGVDSLLVQRKNPKYDKDGQDKDGNKDTHGPEYFPQQRLVFGTKDEVRLQTLWAWPSGQITVRARRGDEQTNERVRTISPVWTRSWSLFSKGMLPDGPGVVTFELTTESGQPVIRSFWRRDP
ncbi:MAG: hypothetical protein GXP62_18710 [Oligoflexia bacterium]|nr:hypothetical protein [Oligoflexia bacterium]